MCESEIVKIKNQEIQELKQEVEKWKDLYNSLPRLNNSW
jgi:hypothetical protein